MRPKLPDNEIRNIRLIIRVSREEKIRIQGHTKKGKYPFMSNYIRVRIFNSNRNMLTFEEVAEVGISSVQKEEIEDCILKLQKSRRRWKNI